jgi:predicted membrane protein (TIGR00267 family)
MVQNLRLIAPFRKLRRKIREHLKLSQKDSIARRYFVLNCFDGAITVFSIVLAAIVTGVNNPKFVVATALGASVAMAVSGFSGAYMAEKAEHERHLNQYEHERNSKQLARHKAAGFTVVYLALIAGLAPPLASLPAIILLLLSMAGLLPQLLTYYLALVSSFIILFLLGIYLGKVSKGNHWKYALLMLAVGGVAASVIFVIDLLL